MQKFIITIVLTTTSICYAGADCSMAAIDSGEKELTHCDFSGWNLQAKDLSEVNFYQANLHNTDFSQANLKNAIFNEAYLENADFTNADLSGAAIHNAQASNVNFTNANLEAANLSGTYFWNANWDNAYVRAVNLVNTHLNKEPFFAKAQKDHSNTDFEGFDFSQLDLTDINLSYSNLYGANFQDAKVPYWREVQFNGVSILLDKEGDTDHINSYTLWINSKYLCAFNPAVGEIGFWIRRVSFCERSVPGF
jgi:uncharacterized protein YjbI with pentapeptide repeats